jgi:hypothetical protein
MWVQKFSIKDTVVTGMEIVTAHDEPPGILLRRILIVE